MATTERSTAAHSQTLDRGLRVLALLAQHPDGLSISEIAKQIGTHRAGVYRLVGPLVAHHLVWRDDRGRYVLGLGLVQLAARVRPRLLSSAEPLMNVLAEEIEATIALTVREGDEAVVVAVVAPSHTPMHIAYPIGMRHPVGVAAPGIALLAGAPPVDGERPEVTTARAAGFAFSHSELLNGSEGIGVAIPSANLSTATAISAVWIGDRDLAAPVAALTEAARRIAAELG